MSPPHNCHQQANIDSQCYTESAGNATGLKRLWGDLNLWNMLSRELFSTERRTSRHMTLTSERNLCIHENASRYHGHIENYRAVVIQQVSFKKTSYSDDTH